MARTQRSKAAEPRAHPVIGSNVQHHVISLAHSEPVLQVAVAAALVPQEETWVLEAPTDCQALV